MSLQDFAAAAGRDRTLVGDVIQSVMNVLFTSTLRAPVAVNTNGLRARALPFPAPLAMSAPDAMATFARSLQYNPAGQIMTAGVTGPGNMVLGLPGAPGVATGLDRCCVVPAVLIDIAVSANVPVGPFTFSVAGVHENGEAYASGTFEYGWGAAPGENQQVLVFFAALTANGPRLSPLRVTTADWVPAFLNNGAPNAVAGDQVTVTVASCPVGMSFNSALITPSHEAWGNLYAALWANTLGPSGQAATAAINDAGMSADGAPGRTGLSKR